MDSNLLKPTLKIDGVKETKTYDISKLFYVAFFGGTIPLTVLGYKNALWLGINKIYMKLFCMAGCLILLTKAVIVTLYAADIIPFDSRDIRWGVKIANVLLYFFMYMKMKPRFYQHILNDGEKEPLLKSALIWIAIGILIELVLMAIGGFIGLYVIK